MAVGGGGEDLGRELDEVVLDDDFVNAAVITERELERRRAAAADVRAADAGSRDALRVQLDSLEEAGRADARRAIHRREVRNRVVILVACAVGFALLVAGFFWLPGGSVAPRSDAGSAPVPDASVGHTLVGEVYAPGDCVGVAANQGDGPEAQQTEVVPCSKAHGFEVVGRAEIDVAAYPSPAEWAALTTEKCTPLVAGHLGHALDTGGRFVIDSLIPTAASWDEGADRSIWCTLHPRDGQPFTGKVKDQA